MNGLPVALFAVLLLPSGNTQSPEEISILKATCQRALPINNSYVRNGCCQFQDLIFKHYWYLGGFYLSRHLELLKLWECKEFVNECNRRQYAYSDFTIRTYDFFCNQSSLEQTCLPILRKKQKELGDSEEDPRRNSSGYVVMNGSDISEWSRIVQQMDFASLSTSMASLPCFQVAQLSSPSGGFGEFHEVLTTTIPFCRMTWCGFSTPVVRNGASPFDCLPAICQANVIILMIAVIFISIMIVCTNAMVLAVFITTKTLHNSQAIYKCSLAAADMLVGLFGLPSFAINLYRMTWKNIDIGKMEFVKNLELAKPFIDWDRTPMPGRDGSTIRQTTGQSALLFDPKLGLATGILTTISLMVSIYSLTMAGFDRLLAVYKPLKYRRHVAKKTATYSTIVIWIVAITFSLLPVMTDFEYAISTVLYVVSGDKAELFYVVLFAIPICIVWVTNILTFIIVRQKNRKRRSLTNNASKSFKDKDNDRRLAVTLMIIVGVFTICCLPAVIISVIFLNFRAFDEEYKPHRDFIFNSIDTVAGIVMMSNSLWNYFIYSARNKDFRKASRELRRKLIPRFRIFRNHVGLAQSTQISINTGSNTAVTMNTVSRNSGSRNTKCKIQTKFVSKTNSATPHDPNMDNTNPPVGRNHQSTLPAKK